MDIQINLTELPTTDRLEARAIFADVRGKMPWVRGYGKRESIVHFTKAVEKGVLRDVLHKKN